MHLKVGSPTSGASTLCFLLSASRTVSLSWSQRHRHAGWFTSCGSLRGAHAENRTVAFEDATVKSIRSGGSSRSRGRPMRKSKR